ncbi:hypothetical protein BDW75DRAFT_241476 [Aspergillus navahoensis]
MASQAPGDIRAPANIHARATGSGPDSNPTAAEHSHVGMDTGPNTISAVDDEEDDREEEENPHLPPLRDGIGDKNVVSKMLARLDRLESHCQLNPAQEEEIQGAAVQDESEGEDLSGSVSSLSSSMSALGESRSPLLGHRFTPTFTYSSNTATAREIWGRIKNPATRPRLISDSLCHLRGVEAAFFENQACLDATEAVIDGTAALCPSAPKPEVVQASTSTPILSSEFARECIHDLAERWLDKTQATATAAAPGQADLLAACFVISISPEAGNIELCWKMLRHACSIAKTLRYFHLDAAPHSSATEAEVVEKNRKRFKFWRLLRTDCSFRLSFGNPLLSAKASGLLTFRTVLGLSPVKRSVKTLVMLQYLDYSDGPGKTDEETLDALIAETETTMALWRPDDLLETKTNYISLLSVDMLLGSYKMLILLDQARQNQNRRRLTDQDRYSRLSPYTVKVARRSAGFSGLHALDWV